MQAIVQPRRRRSFTGIALLADLIFLTLYQSLSAKISYLEIRFNEVSEFVVECGLVYRKNDC